MFLTIIINVLSPDLWYRAIFSHFLSILQKVCNLAGCKLCSGFSFSLPFDICAVNATQIRAFRFQIIAIVYHTIFTISEHASDIIISTYTTCVIAVSYRNTATSSTHASDTSFSTYHSCVIAASYRTIYTKCAHASDIMFSEKIRINDTDIPNCCHIYIVKQANMTFLAIIEKESADGLSISIKSPLIAVISCSNRCP